MELFALSLFGLIILLIAVYGYKISAKTAEDYMLAGRGIGIIVMFFFVLFAISSAWTFYGYPGFLYLHGPCYVYFVWGCVAGFAALYMFLGPRLWAIARLNRFLSPVEALSERYESKPLRLVLAVILLAFIVPYIGIQPIGVGLGFQALTGISPIVGILYTTILLIFIVLLGGMRITAWVNVLLGIIYATAFFGSLIWIVSKLFPGGLSEAASIIAIKRPELLTAPGPKGYFTSVTIGGALIVGLLALSWPHIVISTMTAQDKSIFKWIPLLTFVAGGLLFYSIPFIWGSIVAPAVSHMDGTLVLPVVGKAADNIVQTIITKHLPGWFSTFVLMGVIAAAISTAAVQLMTAAILISRDLIHGFFKPGAKDEQLIKWTKVAVIGIIIFSLGIALWNPVALALYLTRVAVPGFAQWAPALVGGILWKRGTKQGALTGAIAGTVYLIAGFIHPPLVFGLGNPLIPTLIVNVILYIIVSLLTPPPSKQVERRFFDEVDEFLSQ
ncbi:sodium:solute symporter family protein [candidate division WOR-3 bacterium]|nr:sodium:solute symporter family protein [candidate division WOR-3 bacterium]